MESILLQVLLCILSLLVIPAHLDDECPASIYPCHCSSYSNKNHFYCHDIWSGEELKDLIHNSDFGGDTEFYEFFMNSSPLVKVLENGTFWPLTFNRFALNADRANYPKDNDIEEMEQGTFIGSEDTAEYIFAADMNLRLFPFEDLKSLLKLNELRLYNNSLTIVGDLTSSSLKTLLIYQNSIVEIPAISMENLELFNISTNLLTSLPDDVFTNVSKLEILDMSHNYLASLPPHAFHNLISIREMDFSYCHLNDIQPDMWSNTSNIELEDVRLNNNRISILPTGFFTPGSNKELSVDQSNNLIESVQPGAFSAIRSMHIHLEDNMLAVLEEESWRNLLQNRVLLHLEGNPFICGCDVAWLVRASYLFDSIVDEPTCDTGEKLADLNAEDFTEC